MKSVNFFKDCGEIVKFEWFNDKETGRFMGRGIIEFKSVEEALKAVSLNEKELSGRNAMIRAYTDRKPGGGAGTPRGRGGRADRPLSAKPDGCDTVFIGNLSFEITEDDVRSAFGDCGDIASVRWVERDGEFKGIGFLQFSGPADAVDKAVAKKGTDVKGRAIVVDYAQARSKKTY